MPARLFVLRHAKSAWTVEGMPDHERALAPRGKRALPTVAAEINRHLSAPLDLVLGSTATRVRETLAGVLPQLVAPRSVRYSDKLYLADLRGLLKELQQLPADVRSVLLCGHNPGLHQLVLALVGTGAAPDALCDNLPTAGLVVIDLDVEWPEIAENTGRLLWFTVPQHD